jgi:alpha-glucosidase
MTQLKWWQKAVFYQIYPRSFADGNDDGIGDFGGMISKLDYLRDLGIDAIWLSPHFPSPQHDCGYDISDYTSVEPAYGNLDEFKLFLEGCHSRGIRLILDLVLNHTSHQHHWFQESRLSRDHPKRDWYIWRSGRDGGPPNNWASSFGGSAWEYDAATDQYYYHYFFKEQPDLNWRNPEVKTAMFDAARFWLDLGVDGFRLDALGTIFEDPALPDHTVPFSLEELGKMSSEAKTEEDQLRIRKYWQDTFRFQVDQPGLHGLFKELRTVVDEYPDRVLVAEDDDIAYMGDGDNEIHLVFNFPLMRIERLSPAQIRQNQADRLEKLSRLTPSGWPCNTLGNHDSPRLLNRFGDGEHDLELAKLNFTLMLTLRGTPFLYNGEEIGMSDLTLTDISQFRDQLGIWYYNTLVEKLGMPKEQALQIASQGSRDKNRTPMQWENAPNAGFCSAQVLPWLPVNPNYASGINVLDQINDPASLVNFYKHMLSIRKNTPALIAGDYRPILEDHEECLVFTRTTDRQACLIVLNYSQNKIVLNLSDIGSTWEKITTENESPPEHGTLSEVSIPPFGIFIARIR